MTQKRLFPCIFSTFEEYKILIVSLFKQRKNKRFNYTPKYLQDDDIQRKQHIDAHQQQTKQPSKSTSSLLIWLLILGMVIVLWFVLDNYKN